MPFKIKYVIIAAVVLIAIIAGRVIYVNSKFENIKTVDREMDESFEYGDMVVTVTKAEWLDEEKFGEQYGSDVLMTEYYKSLIKDAKLKLLKVTVDVKNITKEGYNDILQWDIMYKTTGNGSTIFTDLTNTVNNEMPEDKEVYLFFRCNPKKFKNPEDIEYFIRAGLFPKQDIIRLKVE